MLKIYTVQEVANALNVSERQVQRMINGDTLPRLEVTVNGRKRLGVEGAVLHAYMKANGITRCRTATT